ncbi:MAG: hypothetical protein ACYTXI_39010 [Nostoc sp.]
MKKVKTIEIKDLQPQIEELDDSALSNVCGGQTIGVRITTGSVGLDAILNSSFGL